MIFDPTVYFITAVHEPIGKHAMGSLGTEWEILMPLTAWPPPSKQQTRPLLEYLHHPYITITIQFVKGNDWRQTIHAPPASGNDASSVQDSKVHSIAVQYADITSHWQPEPTSSTVHVGMYSIPAI